VPVVEGYGQTECTVCCTSNPVHRRRKPGTVGLPLPSVEVTVADEHDRPVPAGQAGQVIVRGPNVMRGYLRKPQQSAEVLRGGWLHTGDVGRFDDDGYLTLVDRIKDVIIRGGFNVYPRDVEDVLLRHPDVAAAAVVGRPDEKYGEEIVAFVQLREGAAAVPAGLIEFGRRHLSAVKYPREVRLVDAIPLTSVMKTDRKLLRAMLAAD
jgi:long-chain acyl-CoA synthetase